MKTTKKKTYSEADMGPMQNYDPNLGMKKAKVAPKKKVVDKYEKARKSYFGM